MIEFLNNSGALFSEDRTHRYLLWRIWDDEKPLIAWLMLNPSIANEDKLDPTLRRCKQYSINNNYGGMIILNIFSLVSTDPKGLKLLDISSHYIEENFKNISNVLTNIPIVLGFGANSDKYHPGFLQNKIYPLLKDKEVYALKITKNGLPSHPLYLSYNLKFQKFNLTS